MRTGSCLCGAVRFEVSGDPILSRATALPDRVRLRAGTVDGDLAVKIISHAFTGQAADWCAVADDAPHFTGARPA